MTTSPLTQQEKQYLLRLARQSIENALHGLPEPEINETDLSANLGNDGASFVTLTIDGQLRGCIGTLEAHQGLALDVRDRAVQAALEDYRFPQLTQSDLPLVKIEISRLTKPEPLVYEKPEDLPGKLHPGVDGIILADGFRRSTFLPQVWEQLPTPEEFLSHLCVKMGAPAHLWKIKQLQVEIYKVEEFHE